MIVHHNSDNARDLNDFACRFALERLTRAFAHALGNAQRNGELDPRLDVDAEAAMLCATALGLFVMTRARAPAAMVRAVVRTATRHVDLLRAQRRPARPGRQRPARFRRSGPSSYGYVNGVIGSDELDFKLTFDNRITEDMAKAIREIATSASADRP